ncbi:hypothetical protein QUF76_16475, partial [Desulfobacterales bacterium HSG16]|nr:hypothetical protein [Desulfobacterales bacterium HSG16]
SGLGGGIDLSLEQDGEIFGHVKKLPDSNGQEDVIVEVYSRSVGFKRYYSGANVTDHNGDYIVKGLRRINDAGDIITDYLVTVYSEDYPPQSKYGNMTGDKIDFVLSEQKQGIVSGTVADMETFLLAGVEAIVNVFEEHGDFIKKLPVDEYGNFRDTTVSPDVRVQLKFALIDSEGNALLREWAGNDDVGTPASEYEQVTPSYAKAYDTGLETASAVNFSFSKNIDEITGLISSGQRVLGRANDQFDEEALSRKKEESQVEAGILNLRPIPYKKVFTDLKVTMSWESSLTGEDEKFYYLFNPEQEFEINKRTAPRGRPLRVKTVTSQRLSGNFKNYYCHVAKVDKRGRIRSTVSTGFMVDTIPPLNGTVIVPEVATETFVTLAVGATGAVKMYFSSMAYGEGGQWEEWAAEKVWRLLEGDGLKKIYVMFEDRSGNKSRAFTTIEKKTLIPDDGDGQHAVTINTGQNGTVFPLKNISVPTGDDITVIILPDQGYKVDKVKVDGRKVWLVEDNRFNFINVQQDYTMDVTFKSVAAKSFVIDASAGMYGNISPSGRIEVNSGADITFTITPVTDYKIAGLEVDGKPAALAAGNTYVFTNISGDHSIKAKFE